MGGGRFAALLDAFSWEGAARRDPPPLNHEGGIRHEASAVVAL